LSLRRGPWDSEEETMSAETELNTVVDTARKTEMDGRKFYADIAARSANPLAKRMFESLAEAEEKHLEFIEALAKGEFAAGPYNQDLSRRLATVFSSLSDGIKSQAKSTEDDIAALDVGIEMEDKSMAFYREWSEKASDEGVRKFCDRLRAEEEDHWRILQSTREYLGETGNWFMVQEGWSFDGG
jgi:rubrerythrin